VIESKDLDRIVSEIEKSFDDKTSETQDKKLQETPRLDDANQRTLDEETKLSEPKGKRLSIFKKKTPAIKEKDTTLSAPDDLTKDKTKPEDSLKIPTVDSQASKEKIKEIKQDKGASKLRIPFFKKEKLPVEKKSDIKPVKKTLEKPVFRVENLPPKFQTAEEAKLLEEKIRKSPKKEDLTQSKNVAEDKAFSLAKEHIKQKKTQIPEKETTNLKEKEAEGPIFSDVPVNDGNTEHEHIFFDEEDSLGGGWGPKIPEKEKKSMLSSVSPKGELELPAGGDPGELELPGEILQSKSVSLSDLGFSENEWEELDFYPLHEPFAYVEILREKESLDKCYFLVEISLSEEEEKLLAFIKDTMRSVHIDTAELEEKGGDEYLLERLDQVINEYDIKIDDDTKKKVYYYIGKSSLGLGKIDPLMKDPNIEDISCDGSGVPVFLYHRKYGSLKSNVKFTDEDELSSFVVKLAQKCGKHISIAEPMLDATMPDGSRIQMTLSDEITAKGSTFTIRKFRDDPFSPPDLIEFNTMSSEMIAYMWIAVENGINTLFAGGTASGKTTTLNALSLFIPRESKIVSIEETREINLPHPNWIPGVARSGFGQVVADKVIGEIDMYDLMKAALRQRPDYIIVGEIRGREAYVLFQAMATGHATYSTVHADSAQSLIHRLEGKPINIPRVMLQSLDIVCMHVITRVKNVRARRCRQIIEIIDIDPTTKEILTNEVFRWDPVEDKFVYSGKSYVLERIRAEKDMTREQMTLELKNRMHIVDWMNKTNLREFRDVAKIVAQYSETPNETLKIMEKDAKK
jgi:type IV secretory pathway ATPase VirB11/archaellum biosynthesis ATPase